MASFLGTVCVCVFFKKYLIHDQTRAIALSALIWHPVVPVSLFVCVRSCICMYVHMYVCMNVFICVCICMYVPMYAYMHLYMYVCMNRWIYGYI